MKINMSDLPPKVLLDRQWRPKEGEVYRAKGPKDVTKFWLVLRATETVTYCLGFDGEGKITTPQRYGNHAFAERELVGHTTIPDIEVKWL